MQYLWRVPALLALAAIGLRSQPKSGAAPLLREEIKLTVAGAAETWQLEWKTPPQPFCGAASHDWVDRSCTGFAFGEQGALDLVRIRKSKEFDRLALAPLFAVLGGENAAVQRWNVEKGDLDIESPDFAEAVSRRPVITVMQFGDYDHDGNPSEFFLQTDVAPGGKRVGVVVGVSGSSPKLHAFTSQANSLTPLVLERREWEELRNAKGPVKVIDASCADHGAEGETELELEANHGTIRAMRREFACTESGRRGALMSETAF